jgi:cell division protein FtsL
MKMKYNEILAPEAPASGRRKKRKAAKNENIFIDQKVTLDYGTAEGDTGKGKQAEFSTFNIIVLLVITALVVTAYISNIITVDALMLELTKLERKETRLLQTRENVRADINLLTSYNRIQKIATQELGLVHSRRQPYSLTQGTTK